jgi:hypothetical protein
MTTLCRAYRNESDARDAVARVLAAGQPGGDIRVLMGMPDRDAREEPHGAFAGMPGEAVGTYAGAAADRGDGMGAFAGDAAKMRGGAFADADRDTVTSYPGGVARVRVDGHRGIERMLVEAGLDEAAAAADVRALHEGRILVLVMSAAPGAEGALDAADA